MMDKCFETIHTRILSTLEAWKEFEIKRIEDLLYGGNNQNGKSPPKGRGKNRGQKGVQNKEVS